MNGVFEQNDLTIRALQVRGFRGYPPMFHTHLEIVYVLSGSIRMQIDGKSRTLEPGQLSVSFPYVIHSYENAPDAEAIILLFAPASVQEWQWQLMHSKALDPYLLRAEAFLPLLRRVLIHDAEGREALTKTYVSALIGELLLKMPALPVTATDLTLTQKVLIYCAEHFREDIGVKDVARSLLVSESSVSKIFARNLGCSFRGHLNALRVTEIKKRLKTTEDRVTDIMYDCGFRNQSSFNQVFLAATGLSPREYRSKYLQKQKEKVL